MNLLRRFWASGPARIIFGVVGGAVGGAVYAHYIGCLTGSCPITSNPVTAALFGALLGATLLAPDRRKPAPVPPAKESEQA